MNTIVPYVAAKIDAIIIHIFASDNIFASANDKDDTNIDIVNPMPPKTLAPYKCLLVTLDGNLAIFNFIKINEVPNIPICFPTKRPNIIPNEADENKVFENYQY